MDREPDQRCGDVTPSRAIHELVGTDSNDGSRCPDHVRRGGSVSGRITARTDRKSERCCGHDERTTSPKDHPDDTPRKVPHHSGQQTQRYAGTKAGTLGADGTRKGCRSSREPTPQEIEGEKDKRVETYLRQRRSTRRRRGGHNPTDGRSKP